MSLTGGSGGGHDIGGGGGGHGPQSSCEQLSFQAALSTPNEAVLRKVKVGWALRVELRPTRGTKVAVVVSENEIVGSIATQEALQLVACLEEGHTFYAQVLEIKDGLCRVHVRHS